MPLSSQGNSFRDSTSSDHALQDSWVLLARLVRPQGRNGEVLAEILTDFPERFEDRRELFLLPSDNKSSPRKVTLEDFWLHKGRIVMKFADINSISDAENLRGLHVALPREQRAVLEDGAFYIADLIGCRVIDMKDGAEVGTISDVDRHSTSTPLLVIGNGKEELLIPFVRAWLGKVDIENKQIEMTLPDGLLTINNGKADD